jgi:hypothetical protein
MPERAQQGDTVRMLHAYGREAVVSSADDDGVMLCMMIAGRYQLRGPFKHGDVEVVRDA